MGSEYGGGCPPPPVPPPPPTIRKGALAPPGRPAPSSTLAGAAQFRPSGIVNPIYAMGAGQNNPLMER